MVQLTVAEVRVHVKPESLTTFVSSGYASGIIYFSSGDTAFPNDVWDDFPVIIVGWWLNALADYKSGFEDSIVLNFMDGPFLVRLFDRSGLTTKIEMIQETSDGIKMRLSTTADLLMLYRSIDYAADILIEFCKKQPREIPDYPELVEAKRRAINAFRSQLD